MLEITRFDGKDRTLCKFKDLKKGEIFICNGGLFVKSHVSIEGWNAISLNMHLSVRLIPEMVVELVHIEWEGDENNDEVK